MSLSLFQEYEDLSSSSDIVEAAKRRLKGSVYADIRQVSCCCDHGVLCLQGALASYYHKQLAQEAVVGVEGVSEVVNEIEVHTLRA